MTRYCNKCGYHGPDMSHKRPLTGRECNYFSAEVTKPCDPTQTECQRCHNDVSKCDGAFATKPQEPIGYDDIFSAIGKAVDSGGGDIEISVKAFKAAIGGEIFLSPTIPAGYALVPIEPTSEMQAKGRVWMGHHPLNVYKAMLAGVTK